MRPAVAVTGLLLCLGSVPATTAQTLGELARQEAGRRQAITAPARVVTNDDLASAPVARPVPAAPASIEGIVPARRVPLSPAVLQTGELPGIPVDAVSGGEVLLEVTVDKAGRVVDATILRDTAPFTDALTSAVRGWQFEPAQDAAAPEAGASVDRATRQAIDAKVLVLGLFRPPGLFPFTLGQPSKDLAAPSEAVPVPQRFPAMPAYPPQALFDGVVLAELRVDASGAIEDARVLRSVPGFDEPTLDVLRGLTFRPARVYGLPTQAMVYVVTAFRQPIVR